ncbi:MAG: hypothetical protein H8K03_14345 [Nitrospira sp.]|jgi:hypothetical protein|nr:hypothetical protein [Nitrospira sp. BO4]
MAKRREIERPTTKSIHSYVTKNAGRVKQTQRLPHHRAESVRTAEYRGHHIVVKTRYAIEVDGRPVMGHLGVTNDGHVHYHPVPNLSFASAVDMVKAIIAVFPDRFPKKAKPKKQGGMHGAKHAHR